MQSIDLSGFTQGMAECIICNNSNYMQWSEIKEITFHRCTIPSWLVLPPKLEKIKCVECKIPRLPVLPDTVKYMDCDHNDLTELPDPLPSSLSHLSCEYNNIKKLPTLPKSIRVVFAFRGNKLPFQYDPGDLPDEMQVLESEGYIEIVLFRQFNERLVRLGREQVVELPPLEERKRIRAMLDYALDGPEWHEAVKELGV